jgi:hypothetical protein
VNWKSDIICPILDLWPRGNDADPRRLVVEFVLGLLSRLPLFRIAISRNAVRYFEDKFGHELAWSRNEKEVFVFLMNPQFPRDRRFRTGRPVLLRFCSAEHRMEDWKELPLGIAHLNVAVGDLRNKVAANRDRCPALAGPFPPLITPMILDFDNEEG